MVVAAVVLEELVEMLTAEMVVVVVALVIMNPSPLGEIQIKLHPLVLHQLLLVTVIVVVWDMAMPGQLVVVQMQ
jgi:hypothetical protein